MREIPIQYQIACVILTALFIWSFSIAREPRGWRRLFQSMFSKSEKFSVNKNKVIDEALKKYGIVIAMIILVADVSCFVMGVTYPFRERAKALSKQERDSMSEINAAYVLLADPQRAADAPIPIIINPPKGALRLGFVKGIPSNSGYSGYSAYLA